VNKPDYRLLEGDVATCRLPKKLIKTLNKFALDKLTGNVRINYNQGEILKFDYQEFSKI